MKPVVHPFAILHLPHASRCIPAEERRRLAVTDRQLKGELLRMTDSFTDELFLPNDPRASSVVFPVSRLVVDPERFEDDASEPMASKGMGVVYLRTSYGDRLRAGVTASERQRLVNRYYRPHHAAVARLVRQALRKRHGCLIIDCHSFSSVPLPHEPDQRKRRPDICLGTDDFHTPPWMLECMAEHFVGRGLAVGVNRPFSGAFVPSPFYKSRRDVTAIMVEVRRGLYMDEASGDRGLSFEAIRAVLLDGLRGLLDRAEQTLAGVVLPRRKASAQGAAAMGSLN